MPVVLNINELQILYVFSFLNLPHFTGLQEKEQLTSTRQHPAYADRKINSTETEKKDVF